MKQKLIIFATALLLWLPLSQPALADWLPEFNPNKQVYIDPALVNNKLSPVEFEAKLAEYVKKFKSTNYYVVAIESSEPRSSGRKLGVLKADALTKAWVSRADFPNTNYAIVAWARSAKDPVYNGVGINVSPNMQSAKEIDIKTIGRTYFPHNPLEGLKEIVNSIDAKSQEALIIGLFQLAVLFPCILVILWWLLEASGAIDQVKEWLTIKERANDLIQNWNARLTEYQHRMEELAIEDKLAFYNKLDGKTPDLQYLNIEWQQLLKLQEAGLGLLVTALCFKTGRHWYKAYDTLNKGNVKVDLGEGGYIPQFQLHSFLDEILDRVHIIELALKLLEDTNGKQCVPQGGLKTYKPSANETDRVKKTETLAEYAATLRKTILKNERDRLAKHKLTKSQPSSTQINNNQTIIIDNTLLDPWSTNNSSGAYSGSSPSSSSNTTRSSDTSSFNEKASSSNDTSSDWGSFGSDSGSDWSSFGDDF